MLIIIKEEGKNRVRIFEFSLATGFGCFRSKLSNCISIYFGSGLAVSWGCPTFTPFGEIAPGQF